MSRSASLRVAHPVWMLSLLVDGTWTHHLTTGRAYEVFAEYHAHSTTHRRLTRNGRVLIDTTTEQLVLPEGA